MTESSEKDYFDTQKFIIEVEKRPALYNKSILEYSDKDLKEELWIEVCEAIVSNWRQGGEDGRILMVVFWYVM